MNDAKVSNLMERRRERIEERCGKEKSADRERDSYERANPRSAGQSSLDNIPNTRLFKDNQYE
ncbi:hypothetical protein D3C77_272420 [compost metagenome]